jgi:hypothetical protein
LALYCSIRFPYYAQQEESTVSKEEDLFTAEQGAFMTRLTMSSFRTKVSRLGVRGKKQGVKVFYSRKQLEAIYKGSVGKQGKAVKAKKKVGKLDKRETVSKRKAR